MSDLISKEKVLKLIYESEMLRSKAWIGEMRHLGEQIKYMASERASDYGRPCRIKGNEEVHTFKRWIVDQEDGLRAVVEKRDGEIEIECAYKIKFTYK